MNKNAIKILFLFCFPGMILSCKKQIMTPGEFVNYCNKSSSGLVVESETDSFIFSVKFMPADLQVLHRTGMNLDATSFDKLKKEYAGNLLFRFSIQHRGIPIQDLLKKGGSLEAIMNQMSFSYQQFFSLQNGKEKIPCEYCQLEQNGFVRPELVFEVAFPVMPDMQNKLRLDFKDSFLFPKGKSFDFKLSDLTELPQIKF